MPSVFYRCRSNNKEYHHRVPGFLSIRPNWVPPSPPRVSLPLPLGPRGLTHSLKEKGMGGGDPIPTIRQDILVLNLKVYYNLSTSTNNAQPLLSHQISAEEVELLLKEAEESLPEDILKGAHRTRYCYMSTYYEQLSLP